MQDNNSTGRKKIVFIVNPKSGSFRIIPVNTLIEYQIDGKLFDYEIVETKYAGHAAVLAAEHARKGVYAVIAVGGDGTVNEVGRSLIGTDTALGIVPCGSGNGLARHLSIPTDAFNYIRWLNSSVCMPVDYGMINEHPFFCTCGIGFDAQVSAEFAESKLRGPIAYVEKIMRELLTYRKKKYKLVVDGVESSLKAYIITVANANQWGNNVYIAPQAQIQDGLLDMVALTDFDALDIPLILYQLLNKQLHKNRKVLQETCKELTIIRESDGVAQFDGEPVFLGKEINIRVVHHGLKVLAPVE